MNAQRARQPDCTVYIHLELGLVCFVFRVVSSSESKRLIFCESCMLENGAACYKLSSVISKTVRLMGSSTRCENKEGFVVIPANVYQLPSGLSLQPLGLCNLLILLKQNNVENHCGLL